MAHSVDLPELGTDAAEDDVASAVDLMLRDAFEQSGDYSWLDGDYNWKLTIVSGKLVAVCGGRTLKIVVKVVEP